MITVDTNVIVRYLIKDDEIQAQLAIELFENNQCFISPFSRLKPPPLGG